MPQNTSAQQYIEVHGRAILDPAARLTKPRLCDADLDFERLDHFKDPFQCLLAAGRERAHRRRRAWGREEP